MISFSCYIVYSKSLDKYYIGYTSDIRKRIILHNSGHFGGKAFTSKSSDWEIFLEIPCETIEHAINVESRIKKMKSRRYIQNLKKYPELVDQLKSNFKNWNQKRNLLFVRIIFCLLKIEIYICSPKRRCHSSVGRAQDWKSWCPRPDSYRDDSWLNGRQNYKM